MKKRSSFLAFKNRYFIFELLTYSYKNIVYIRYINSIYFVLQIFILEPSKLFLIEMLSRYKVTSEEEKKWSKTALWNYERFFKISLTFNIFLWKGSKHISENALHYEERFEFLRSSYFHFSSTSDIWKIIYDRYFILEYCL